MAKKAAEEKLMIPEQFDWRERDQNGVISEVKNQGRCGCCWAQVTIGAMEAICFIENKLNVKLSTQDLVNCVIPNPKPEDQDEMGCYAVNIPEVLSWVAEFGCVTESSCPYQGKKLECNPNRQPILHIKGFRPLPLNANGKGREQKIQERKIQEQLLQHPLIASLVGTDEFINWKGDAVYSGQADARALASKPDHVVLVVGYGQKMEGKNLTKYWVVRNSWGDDWGNGGFGRIKRDPIYISSLKKSVYILSEFYEVLEVSETKPIF